jgi:hypothetical protein
MDTQGDQMRMTKIKLLEARLKEQIGEPMLKQLQGMFQSTWQAIASDWLEMYPKGECGGAAVQEAVADADRFDMAGDKDAASFWRGLDRKTQDDVLDYCFPKRERFGC